MKPKEEQIEQAPMEWLEDLFETIEALGSSDRVGRKMNKTEKSKRFWSEEFMANLREDNKQKRERELMKDNIEKKVMPIIYKGIETMAPAQASEEISTLIQTLKLLRDGIAKEI